MGLIMKNKIIEPQSLKLVIQHSHDVIKYAHDESKKYGDIELSNLLSRALNNLDQVIDELTDMSLEKRVVSRSEH